MLLLGLAGCISLNIIPTDLPLPQSPQIAFKSCGPDICLTPTDANRLDRYFQEMAAFRGAWERLRTKP